MRRFPVLALALALAAVQLPSHVRADELTDARKLLRGGDREQAMKLVERVLEAKPQDQQGRFLKGVILAEQGQTAAALEVYVKLTQDFPELPEAYNNAAVLYAARGELERAREALGMAIRTNPGYATAYENLGDIYAQLAGQAYDRATQLDANNKAARAKLTLARDITKPRERPDAGKR